MPVEEEKRIKSIFQEVIKETKKIVPDFPDDIKLFYDPTDLYLNAFTCGSKTVCVTEGFLRSNIDHYEMAGIIAHEIGHIVHGDFTMILFRMFSNLIIDLFFGIIFIMLAAASLVITFVAAIFGGEYISLLVGVSASWEVVKELHRNWIKLTNIFYFSANRKIEAEADEFACSLNPCYAQGMLKFFKNNTSVEETTSLFDSHPSNASRIESITKAINENSYVLQDRERKNVMEAPYIGTWKGTVMGLLFVLLSITLIICGNLISDRINRFAIQKSKEELMDTNELPSYFGHTYWMCIGAASDTESVDRYCKGLGGRLAVANLPGESAFISNCVGDLALYENWYGEKHLYNAAGKMCGVVADNDNDILQKTRIFVVEFDDGRKSLPMSSESENKLGDVPIYLGFFKRQFNDSNKEISANSHTNIAEMKISEGITVGFNRLFDEYSDHARVVYEDIYQDMYIDERFHTLMSGEDFLKEAEALGINAQIIYNSRLKQWQSDHSIINGDNYTLWWFWSQKNLSAESCHVVLSVRGNAENIESFMRFEEDSSQNTMGTDESSDEYIDDNSNANHSDVNNHDQNSDYTQAESANDTEDYSGSTDDGNVTSGRKETFNISGFEFSDAFSSPDDELTYIYDPKISGVYLFQINCDSDMAFYCTLYDSENNILIGPGPFEQGDKFAIDLSEGNEYHLLLKPSRGIGSFKFQITVPEEIKSIEENMYSGKVSFDGQKNTYTYTAPVSGEYTFYITLDQDDIAIYNKVYKDGEMISPIGPYSNDRDFSVELVAGEIYQIVVSPAWGQGTYQVRIEQPGT